MSYQLGYDVDQTFDPASTADAAAPPDSGAASVAAALNQGSDLGGRVAETADRAAQYNGYAASRALALYDAAANRIAAVKQATGVSLDNPVDGGFGGGYDAEARAQLASTGRLQGVGQELVDPNLGADLAAARLAVFQGKLADLQQRYPEKAAAIGADRPLAQDAIALANTSSQQAAAAYEAYRKQSGWLPAQIAAFAGGLASVRRDPLTLASFAIGGGQIRAAAFAGKVLEGAARQAAFNSGLQLLQEPGIQSWRAESGQASGILPAAEDIGWAALLGAIPGALHGVASAIWHRAPIPAAEQPAAAATVAAAARGDPQAAQALAGLMPRDAAPTLHAAVAAKGLDDAALPASPPDVHPNDAAAAVRDAIHFGEAPEAVPLPEPPPAAASEAPARAAVAGKQGFAAIEALRAEPEATAGALASNDPALRQAGQVASLSDEAFRRVEQGGADPAIAAHVAAIAEPADHAAILDEVRDFAPSSPDEARQIVSDAVRQRAAPEAHAATLGPEAGERPLESFSPAPAEVPAPQRPHDSAVHAAAQVKDLEAAIGGGTAGVDRQAKKSAAPRELSLLQFLAGAGLAPHPELRAVLGNENPFVPGFGRLIRRKGGLSLDDARAAAEAEGYIVDSGTLHGTTPQTDVNTLLDMVGREHGGEKIYRAGAEPPISRAQQREQLALSREAGKFEKQVVAAVGSDSTELDRNVVARAVERLMGGADDDPALAFEHAAMETREQDIEHEQRQERFGDIPGFDEPLHEPLPDDAAGSSGRGEAAARPDGERAAEGGDLGTAREDGGASRGDDRAPASRDLLDLTPIGERSDGADMRAVPAAEERPPREDGLWRLVQDCGL